MWIPNPQQEAASHYLRSVLANAVAAKRWEDIWPLVAVLYDLEDRDTAPQELRKIFQDMSDAHACMHRIERWAQAAGLAHDVHFMQVVMPAADRLHQWLRQRVRAHTEFEQILTDDPTTLLTLARGADMAIAVELQRKRNPKVLPLSLVIQGPSGAGKELLAEALHKITQRSNQTAADFGPLNCSGLPTELIESELFGHKKGSFTGAVQDRRGLIEAHATGTVFLDEIGDTPAAVQVRLLRFLNDGEIRRVGEDRPRRVAPWVVCATHRDLPLQVKKGEFREDLLFRLCGNVLTLPSLAARSGDIIPVLTECLRQHAGRAMQPQFTTPARVALEMYPWPGNLRVLSQLARELVGNLPESASQLVIDIGMLPPLIQQHYFAARSVSDQFVDLYEDRMKEERENGSGLRDALVGTYGAGIRSGAHPDLHAALFVERLVGSPFFAVIAGQDVGVKAHAVAKYRREEAASRLQEALLQRLSSLDGQPVSSAAVVVRAPSEDGLPRWVREMLKLGAEAALANSQLVVTVRALLGQLDSLSPTARSAIESLFAAVVADAKTAVADESPSPKVRASARAPEPPPHPWDEVRRTRSLFEAYLKRYGTAVAMAAAFRKSGRAVRDAAKALGIKLPRGGSRTTTATGRSAGKRKATGSQR